jgi:hypothetical protein
MITAADVQAQPHRYALPAYGYISAESAARLFNRWETDRGQPSPPLCRRCGQVLRFHDDGAQLHDWCDPNHPPNTGSPT